jgi:hypothetical protein
MKANFIFVLRRAASWVISNSEADKRWKISVISGVFRWPYWFDLVDEPIVR